MRKWLAVALSGMLLLAGAAGAMAGTAAPAYTFTVVFQGESIPAGAEDVIGTAGGEMIAAIPEIGVMQVRGPAALMERLGREKGVAAIGPSLAQGLPATLTAPAVSAAPVQTDETSPAADLYALYQWDIQQVTGNGASYTLNRGSHETVVAILDSGVDTGHPDLAANILGGRNFVPDGENGSVLPDDLADRHGHGTHVAGAIAGNGRILGVGPDLGLRIYRVVGADGLALNFWIMQGIVAAAQDGADVISMSLGGYDVMAWGTWTDPETGLVYSFKDVADFVAFKRAVRYAVNQGVVVVAAAGNEATDVGNPHAVASMLNQAYGPEGIAVQGAARVVPASLPGVAAVSATGPQLLPALYTNYGAGVVTVSAPGGDFRRWPADEDYYLDFCFSAFLDGGYTWMIGTSMATPKVSAVAALIIDQARDSGTPLRPAQVVSRLSQSTLDLGKNGYDPFYGHGLINAYRALGGQ